MLQEFNLAFNHSGDYLLKPSVLNTVERLNLPYRQLDFNLILTNAKDVAAEPHELRNDEEMYSQRMLANYAIDMQLISFSMEGTPHMTIRHPFV